MGYFYNHLATLVMGVFAAVLSGLWPIFVNMAPILELVFMISVPIAWFLTAMCWLSQRSNDYSKKYSASHHYEKKSLNNQVTKSQIYTSNGKLASAKEISDAQTKFTEELNKLKDTVRIKDSEIDRLKQEISNLQTLVQIESLKTELANLKMLASGKSK